MPSPCAVSLIRPDHAAPRKIHILGPFNSGSSFAEHLLRTNDLAFTDLDFQQTLFKHYPPALIGRLIEHLDLDCREILFVAVARDPAAWIDAMQRNRYELVFDDLEGPCRLDTGARNFYKTYREHLLEAALPSAEIEPYFAFSNVFDFWQACYQGYTALARHAAVAVVRYEDMLTDTAEVVLAIAAALGRPCPDSILIPMRPSKDHGDALTFVQARQKLAGAAGRGRQAARIRAHIDRDLLDRLHYS